MSTAIPTLNSDQVTLMAAQVLVPLDGLTLEQVADVLREAERQVSDFGNQVSRITVFRSAIGGTTVYIPKTSKAREVLLNQGELGVQGANQVGQHGHGG